MLDYEIKTPVSLEKQRITIPSNSATVTTQMATIQEAAAILAPLLSQEDKD